MSPLLLKHLSGESIGRFPVWMMRQAGRYLQSYRDVRKGHSFWEMVQTPELATKVSLLPLSELNVDAVIFFSDILTFPHGMGLPIELKESVGPVIQKPLITTEDYEVFLGYDAKKHTPYVGETLSDIAAKIPSDKTLIGFAGAPWTVASYLSSDHPKKRFEVLRTWQNRDPEGLAKAFGYFGEATSRYLMYQIEQGAQMVQLFETWCGELEKDFFQKFYLPVLNDIIEKVQNYRKVPIALYTKNACHLYNGIHELDIDVLSVDSLLKLDEIENLTQGKFSLQGNLDPTVLLTDEATVRRKTRELVQTARQLKRPAILNLGHGILPPTPVQNARAFIEEARALWI